MSDYYDKQGQSLTLFEWAALVARHDPAYKRVLETTLTNGRWVSTVWVGLNHQFGTGPPLIFETMVFPKEGDFSELDMARYGTIQEAQTGHDVMVQKWSNEP